MMRVWGGGCFSPTEEKGLSDKIMIKRCPWRFSIKFMFGCDTLLNYILNGKFLFFSKSKAAVFINFHPQTVAFDHWPPSGQ